MGVRSGVGAGANGGRKCRCGPFEGLRNMGRRRRAKGMRRPHIVVGSHELNSVIKRKRVQKTPRVIDLINGSPYVIFHKYQISEGSMV